MTFVHQDSKQLVLTKTGKAALEELSLRWNQQRIDV